MKFVVTCLCGANLLDGLKFNICAFGKENVKLILSGYEIEGIKVLSA